MATCQLRPVLELLRRASLVSDGAGLTDGQLLSRFIERRDEAAFEALLRRHGPMVLAVSRRLLRNHHDAEDAFQATFLVLVRKAASVAPPEKLANWLYGVAYRTALKAKETSFKRAMRERLGTARPEAVTLRDPCNELRPLLDQELSGLPNKYRLPIILCALEGMSIKEAARQLGWPQGTLAGRLARARNLLAKRVARQGLILSDESLAAMLSPIATSPYLEPSIISSTIKAASLLLAGKAVAVGVVSGEVAALTKGVMKAMLLNKIKTAMAMVLTIGVVGLGGGALSYYALAGEGAAPKGQQEKLPPAGEQVNDGANHRKPAQTDEEKLQGIWKLVKLEALGTEWRGQKFNNVGNLAIEGERLFSPDREMPESSWGGNFKLDTGKKPKRITITDQGPNGRLTFYGIYSIDENELRLCLNEDGTGTAVPREFKTEEGSPFVLTVFKRGAIKQVGVVADQKNLEDSKKTKELAYAGGFESMRGFDFRGIDNAAEKVVSQYQVECTIVKVDPLGKDLGADGKGKILAQPNLIVPEGKESSILLGGQVAVTAENGKTVEFLDDGLSVRLKILGLTEKGVRLETVLERTEVESSDQNGVLVRGNKVRSIRFVKLGEAAKLVEKDDRGEARHWVRVRVLNVEFVVPRTPTIGADSTKNRQSGLDHRLPFERPVGLDFGFPIKKALADDKQLFNFWAGFFGH